MTHKQQPPILKNALIAWTVFTAFYWVAAYTKPFHVDEFYSWVYSERSSFAEILTLKEFGIGHPPMYHLVQKTVQTVMPEYHFLYVRLANYFFGSVFILVLAGFFLSHTLPPVFCYGVASSATLLDVFVFSRMWGLVCLFALLLLITGEKYYHRQDRKLRPLLFIIMAAGIFSDYNFILLVPYLLIILFSKNSFFQRSLPFLLSALTCVLLAVNFLHWLPEESGTALFLLNIFQGLKQLCTALATVVFNFRFKETFLSAGILFLVVYFQNNRLSKKSMPSSRTAAALLVLTGLIMLTAFNLVYPHETALIRYILPITLLFVWFFLKAKDLHLMDLRVEKNRMIITVFCAALILLCVDPFFWRNLTQQRFVFILFPYLLFLFYRSFNSKILYVLSGILFVSGLLYLSSNGISDDYPPTFNKTNRPLLFENSFAYSTQYMKHGKNPPEKPVFINEKTFSKYCETCRIQETPFDVSAHDTIWVIANQNSDFETKRFQMVCKNKDFNLSWTDRFQFRFLTPFVSDRYALFEFHRTISGK